LLRRLRFATAQNVRYVRTSRTRARTWAETGSAAVCLASSLAHRMANREADSSPLAPALMSKAEQGAALIVELMFTSPRRGAPQVECERLTLQAGMGVVGDRNFGISKHPGQNLTLVEAEELESFCAEQSRIPDLSLTRRNLITRGVRLNDLVNVEFAIGGVRLRGVELCEPCAIFGGALSSQSLPVAAVIKRWVGRGGLRADVLSGGEIIRGARVGTGA